GQHPIVVGRAPEGTPVEAESDRAAITEQAPVVADDAEPKRHFFPVTKPKARKCASPRWANPPMGQSKPHPSPSSQLPRHGRTYNAAVKTSSDPPLSPWPPVTFSALCS